MINKHLFEPQTWVFVCLFVCLLNSFNFGFSIRILNVDLLASIGTQIAFCNSLPEIAIVWTNSQSCFDSRIKYCLCKLLYLNLHHNNRIKPKSSWIAFGPEMRSRTPPATGTTFSLASTAINKLCPLVELLLNCCTLATWLSVCLFVACWFINNMRTSWLWLKIVGFLNVLAAFKSQIQIWFRRKLKAESAKRELKIVKALIFRFNN